MIKIWKAVQSYSSKVIGEERAKNFVSLLKNCWGGKVMLYKIFWLYGMAISFALSLLFVAPLTATGGRLGKSLALIIIFPYVVWVLKSIWVSVDNIECDDYKGVPKVYLSLAAKIVVIFAGVNYFLALFG